MQTRSLSRELALLILGQVTDDCINLSSLSIDNLLNKALDCLTNYWREGLDLSASQLDVAQQALLDSELNQIDNSYSNKVRTNLKLAIDQSENVLNSLSETLELTKLLALGNQEVIRSGAINRAALVLKKNDLIDDQLNSVMEGWRLKRLAKIDQDILRIAYVDLNELDVPIAVACNEAVNLANRYSDMQGRRMINGILRRLQEHLILQKA